MNKKIEKILKYRSWVRIVHHIPGRIRLKYKSGIITHLASFNSQNIEKALKAFPALKSYKLTPSTGSVLVEYDAILVNPSYIDELFSEDDNIAQQACYGITESLNFKGKNNE